MRGFLVWLSKKIGYLVAILIIIAAIFVSLARFITPMLEKNHLAFEAWVSDLLGTPVKIKNINLSWYRYEPELSLNNVTILNEEDNNPILQIKKIRIFFSFSKSLWQREVVLSGLMVSGANLNLYENSKGAISVQGFPLLGGFANQPYKNETKLEYVMTWLSAQPRLFVEDINVSYTGYKEQKYFVTLYDLSFINAELKHQIYGKAILKQTIPTEVNIIINWQGKITEPEQIKANSYLYVSGLSLPQWLRAQSFEKWQVKAGILSAKVWVTWAKGGLQEIQSILQAYNLKLFSQTNNITHTINRVSGHFGWRRQNGRQIIAGNDILLDLPSRLWPVTHFYVSLNENTPDYLSLATAKFGYVNIDDLKAYLHSLQNQQKNDLFTRAVDTISSLKLQGVLEDTEIKLASPWTDWTQGSLSTSFSDIGFVKWQNYPAVEHFTGRIVASNAHGELLVNSNNLHLQLDNFFLQPINIAVNGKLVWSQNKDNFLIQLPLLQLSNADLNFNANGAIIPGSPSGMQNPYIDLNTNFDVRHANKLINYLPMKLLGPNLAQWLKTAFISGELPSGRMQMKGRVQDFPFEKNNGIFSLSSQVKNINLKYAQEWPSLNHMYGSLNFSGRSFAIDVQKAQLLNIVIPGIQANLPYIGEAHLEILNVVSKPIATDFDSMMNFIHRSPLENSIGKIFKNTEIMGPTNLNLSLTIPLADPYKMNIKGDIETNNASMRIIPWQLSLNDIKGKFHFTENSITSPVISALLFNKPFQFNFKTIKKSSTSSVVQASFNTNLGIKDVEHWFKLSAKDTVSGSTDLTGKFSFSLDAPIEIQLDSNLRGLTINLPQPYNKKSDESRSLTSRIIVAEKKPLRFYVNYNNLISVALLLGSNNTQQYFLDGGNIHIGPGIVDWPQHSGLNITGMLNSLDIDELYQNQNEFRGNNVLKLINNVDVLISNLNLLGQQLTDARVQINPRKENLDVYLVSSQWVGQLSVPKTLDANSLVTAQFQELNLQPHKNIKQVLNPIDIKTLPAISFDAANVTYDKFHFGRILFNTTPINDGLRIRQLRIVSPRIDLFASGEWKMSDGTSYTHLLGFANSRKVDDLLSSFGFNVDNFIASNGRLNFNLAWSDVPYAPSLATLNGDAKIELGKGRIVDIGQSSQSKMDLGRMLSIFSLQSLPRRLSLDFSDLFQKGYSYDFIKGDFRFRNGDAYTRNLHFSGPVASVMIKGRIGLKKEDFDFKLSVTPYVTSTIPIAATLLTGQPWIGLAALAVNTLFSKAITTYSYNVTGPWDNPSWETINQQTMPKSTLK